MQMTETTTDLVTTMARAEVLARVLHGQTADGDAPTAIKQAKRVAQAVRTDRQRAILWSHQALNHEAVTWEMLIVLGVDQLVAGAADNLGRRHRESVRDYAERVAACDDTDVLAVLSGVAMYRLLALIDNQIKDLRGARGRAPERYAGGLEEGTPCAEARHRRPGEPAARGYAAGWRGGRQPPDGAGPA